MRVQQILKDSVHVTKMLMNSTTFLPVWSLCIESHEWNTCYLAQLLTLPTVLLLASLSRRVDLEIFGALILAACMFERGSWTGIPSQEVGQELSPYNPLWVDYNDLTTTHHR